MPIPQAGQMPCRLNTSSGPASARTLMWPSPSFRRAADKFFRVARGQPPDDQLDRVLVPAAEGHARGDRPDGAVDSGVGEALLARALEHLLVESLAADHLGRKEGGRGSADAGAHLVHDGRLRLRGQRPAAAGAVLPAELAVEQAQEVVGLRQRRDGGAPPAELMRCSIATVGARPRDHVDIGPLHDLHVLADVGRQALEVAPLALGEEDVEGQGGLARPGDARQHDQLVVGQCDVDVLQVVLAGAANLDRSAPRAGRHRLRAFRRPRRPVRSRRLQPAAAVQVGLEEAPGAGGRARPPSPAGRPPPPGRPLAALRAEVDHPVGGLDHVHVVLDHQHACGPRRPGAAARPSSTPMSSKCRPVVGSSKMKSVCRPSRLARRRWRESFSRWDSPPDRVLIGWPSADVAEPDVGQGLQRPGPPRAGRAKKTRAWSTVMSSRSVIVRPR